MKKKILVIDDETDFLDEMKVWLTAKGFFPLTAENGVDGLERLKEDNPDLVILDISMPKKDGFSVLNDIRRELPGSKVPIVMLTAAGQTESIFKAQQMGAADYFIKPFEEDEMMSLLERYLG